MSAISFPVTIQGFRYGDDGLWNKESQKLYELINYEVEDTNIIMNNIQKFRWLTNGRHKVDSVL